eukprot:CAMPEP_0174264140 /NCGR_PEP_ID=MMETSP0439-20130205/21466_1 /TAXON_ID=0 /ORGANISM="Stereomyxa ramosa, Strain Chinc5" /LENGTH=668 /DNA_ID=CAMNT_0015349875 /DNA_START=1 /DNA_END=2007 /DNA_ORIENTATION=-
MTREEMMKELKSTTQLDVSRQELTSKSIPQYIVYMVNLRTLKMSSNKFTDLPSRFGKLTKLQALGLDGNQFEHLPKALGSLSLLELLDLRNNKLVDLSGNILKKMVSLKKLLLRHNRLVALPPQIEHLVELQFLSARNNHIIRLPSEINLLSKLEVLDLRGNQLKVLPCVGQLTNLQELDLQHNSLERVPSDIRNLTSLCRLSLGYNYFVEFPEAVTALSRLRHLDLEGNEIPDVPPEIANMSSLDTLYLSNNQLETLPEEISEVTTLEKLFLSNNFFVKLPSFLKKLTRLTDLKLQNNPLELSNQSENWQAVLRNFSFIANFDFSQTEDKNSVISPRSNSRALLTRDGVSIFSSVDTPPLYALSPREEARVAHQLQACYFPGDAQGSEKKSKRKSNTSTDLLREYFVLQDTNPEGLKRANKEQQQEDAECCLYPFGGDRNMALFCVFDGHAGVGAALSAAQLFPKEFKKQIQKAKKRQKERTDYSEEIHISFINTDKAMTQHQYEGTTATTVFIWGEGGERYLQCGNVGDSSACLCANGKAITLTRDHKLTNGHERDRISSSGVFLNEGQTRIVGIGVTRVLGDHFAKDSSSGMIAAPFTTSIFQITEEHTHIIIASDGLWDVVSPNRAAELVCKEESAEAMTKRLMKAALSSKECQDNVTIIVVVL